ncbi:MAG: glycyl-radical enzyme activating protein [Clostridiales bacterium]|nr:glycyl-radical enzyme activating protein [Clostridiales bacterium]
MKENNRSRRRELPLDTVRKDKTALIGAIQKFSTEDGPGIRTTVFFKGCPLHCAWCHNPELISFHQQIIRMPNRCIHCGYCLEHCPQSAVFVDAQGVIDVDREKCDQCLKCADFCYAKALQAVAREMTVDEIMTEVVQDRGFYEHTGGGMTVSGGEILSQASFVGELIDRAFQAGIRVCLDTSGFGDGQALLRLAAKPNVTNILYDMKSIDDTVHQTYTGQSNRTILDNLKLLLSDPKVRPKLWMRMPLIAGINDSREIISQTAEFYREHGISRVTLLPYHNLGVSKMRNIGGAPSVFEAPAAARVEEIRSQFEQEAKMTVDILGKL